MTTIGIPQTSAAAAAAPPTARGRTRLQDNLLTCEILAALGYVVTDVLGVLCYRAYVILEMLLLEVGKVDGEAHDEASLARRDVPSMPGSSPTPEFSCERIK